MWIVRNAESLFDRLNATHPIVAVVGPRQAGKTTFLKQQMQKKQASHYVTLDDLSAKTLFDQETPEKFEQQYLDRSRINVLDEVQYGLHPGIKLKHWADQGYKLWISSSSQRLLESSVLSYLAGRVGLLPLYGFDLGEYLLVKNQKAYTQSTLEQVIWEHAVYGSYPHACLTPGPEDKKLILKNLFTTVLLKDTFVTFGVQDQSTLIRLSRYLAVNSACELNYRTAAQAVGISIPTLHKYLEALEKSYLVQRVQPFFTNKNLELVKQPKVYFVDTGMRNAVLDEFPNDLTAHGRLFENYLYSELVKLGYSPQYWKNKNNAEVDFIVHRRGRPVPIEVKLFSEANVSRSLRSFIEKYAPSTAYVACYQGEEKTLKIGETPVRFLHPDHLLDRLKTPES